MTILIKAFLVSLLSIYLKFAVGQEELSLPEQLMMEMHQPYVQLRSAPDYDYDLLAQEYYGNGGQWKKRSAIGKRNINTMNPLAEVAKRRRLRNKAKNSKLARKFYPVFFP